jgi:hypothetical protein
MVGGLGVPSYARLSENREMRFFNSLWWSEPSRYLKSPQLATQHPSPTGQRR